MVRLVFSCVHTSSIAKHRMASHGVASRAWRSGTYRIIASHSIAGQIMHPLSPTRKRAAIDVNSAVGGLFASLSCRLMCNTFLSRVKQETLRGYWFPPWHRSQTCRGCFRVKHTRSDCECISVAVDFGATRRTQGLSASWRTRSSAGDCHSTPRIRALSSTRSSFVSSPIRMRWVKGRVNRLAMHCSWAS